MDYEGLLRISLVFKEIDGLIRVEGGQSTHILGCPRRFIIEMKFDRPRIIGSQSSKEVIKSLCIRHTVNDRFSVGDIPFPNTGSLVSRTLDQFGKSDLTRRHPPPFAPARITPRQQSGTRGSTNRLRVEGCKHSPLLGQLIQSWSFICLTAIAPQVGVSLIIRKNDYDIGLISVRYQPEGNGYQKGQKNSHYPIRNNF